VPVIRIEGDGPQGDPEDEGLEFSPRGFAMYGRVPTTYGEIVSVYESSSAEGPHIWMSFDAPDGDKEKSQAVHLNLEQAIDVCNNLNRAIERGARLYGIELTEDED
jgi:hypothetical protein